MNDAYFSIRDALYEKPGPKARRRIAAATAVSLVALAVLFYVVIHQFYITGQLDARYWSVFTKLTTWRFLAKGLLGTIKVALGACVVSFSIAMLMMLGRLSSVKPLSWFSTALIELSRGIPTLLFIYFFFLVTPQMGITLPVYWKITLPVAISASGVVAEVLRSGVNAVPKGQREAALSLGMREHKVFFKIIFPQAFRYVIPALIAELVIVLKDTTFAYVVSYADMMLNARVLISNYDALLSIYLVVAVIYILINYLLHKISVTLAGHRKTAAV